MHLFKKDSGSSKILDLPRVHFWIRRYFKFCIRMYPFLSQYSAFWTLNPEGDGKWIDIPDYNPDISVWLDLFPSPEYCHFRIRFCHVITRSTFAHKYPKENIFHRVQKKPLGIKSNTRIKLALPFFKRANKRFLKFGIPNKRFSR